MGPSPPASRPGNQAQGSRRLAPMGGPRGAPSSKPCPPSLGCRSLLSSPLPSFQYLGPGPVPRVTHKWGADRNAAGVTSRAGDLGDVMGGRAARPVVGPQARWTSRAQRGRRAPRRLWTSPPCEGEVLPRSPPPRPGSGGPAGWCCPTAQAWAHRETPGKWPWPGAGGGQVSPLSASAGAFCSRRTWLWARARSLSASRSWLLRPSTRNRQVSWAEGPRSAGSLG